MKTKPSKILLEKKLAKKSFATAYQEVEFLVRLGVAIAKLREKAKLSQSQLAKLLGTTQSVISRIENGNQNISLKMLKEITHVLKCKTSLKMNDEQVALI